MNNNNNNGIHKEIKTSGHKLQAVTNFKYLGAIISDAGSDILPIWNDQNVTLVSKVRLMRTLIISIHLYSCATWTLTTELQRRIKAEEMRCYRRLLHISFKYHIIIAIVCNKIQTAIGTYEDIINNCDKRKLYDGSDMWSDQMASVKRSFKALYSRILLT